MAIFPSKHRDTKSMILNGNAKGGEKRKASDPYHTAATDYPCCIPALGEFIGSWLYGTCLSRQNYS